MVPRTRYARSGDATIAYQVVGEGSLDLLFMTGWISQVEQLWESSGLASAGEVLVSGTVFGTVVGGPFTFEDRGLHELKGVPGRWPLFALLR
jgi:hypothetical protein